MRFTAFTAARLGCLLALAFTTSANLYAQDADHDQKPAPPARHADDTHRGWVLKTYRLTGATQQNDANETLIALRNMVDPSVKIYLVANQNAIVLFAPPEQQELAQTIIRELDRLKPTYRVKYTLSEFDSGKRIGVQHYSVVAFDGQRAMLKDGSKIPVITGSSSPADKSTTVYQYLDIGLNLDLTATRVGDTVTLKNKVEQSSTAEQRTMVSGAQEPVVRQAVYEGVVSVPLGKPMVIGTMDVPDSTRRVEIEVLVEPAS